MQTDYAFKKTFKTCKFKLVSIHPFVAKKSFGHFVSLRFKK